jgi:hypothetical protein
VIAAARAESFGENTMAKIATTHWDVFEHLPQGTSLSRDFWESPTLDELAQSQNVRPMPDVRALFGTWPGDMDDDFEMAIDDLRHSRVGRDSLS